MSTIDCHALVFAADTARYPFARNTPPPEPGELDACTEADKLGEALASGSISGAVLVQRSRLYDFDNTLICDLAMGDPRLRALVSVDGRRPASLAEARRLLALPGVAGLRMMEPEKSGTLDWLAGEHARGVWSIAADAGAIVDVHVFPWNRTPGLAQLASLLRDFPGVPVLLDNLGNGPVENGAPDFRLDAAAASVIDCPQLMLKFSEMTLGRIERAGLDLSATLAQLARRVGAERLLWGSDILPPKRSLAEAAERAVATTAALPAAEQRAILSGNAARLFGLA